MYRYETHMHSAPVSRCARASVRESLEYYKKLGYDGVFVTNHFLDGNVNIDPARPYEEKINFFFSDYEEALSLSEEIGIKVFAGVEVSYYGIDFLVYGLDKEWYLQHPEIMEMPKKQELAFMMEEGALIIHAHPFREDFYIDHIHLFPHQVHGVEIINASRPDTENEMATLYAKHYGLLEMAGSDNHSADKVKRLAGVEFATPVESIQDFITKVKNNEMSIFTLSGDELLVD